MRRRNVMTDYGRIDELRLFHLEDSWVLDVMARPGVLAISIEVVLRPDALVTAVASSGSKGCRPFIGPGRGCHPRETRRENLTAEASTRSNWMMGRTASGETSVRSRCKLVPRA